MTAGSGSVAPENQLELGLGVPRLAIEPEWKAQPRLWGHSLHPMCSYLASFPAALAHAFVARYSRPGDVVLDPFSGRGTAPLQAAARAARTMSSSASQRFVMRSRVRLTGIVRSPE